MKTQWEVLYQKRPKILDGCERNRDFEGVVCFLFCFLDIHGNDPIERKLTEDAKKKDVIIFKLGKRNYSKKRYIDVQSDEFCY